MVSFSIVVSLVTHPEDEEANPGGVCCCVLNEQGLSVKQIKCLKWVLYNTIEDPKGNEMWKKSYFNIHAYIINIFGVKFWTSLSILFSRFAISHAIQRCDETRSPSDTQRNGRQCVSTVRDDRRLVRISKQKSDCGRTASWPVYWWCWGICDNISP